MLSDHGVVIDQETVRRIIKGLDPGGVEMRSKRRWLGMTNVYLASFTNI